MAKEGRIGLVAVAAAAASLLIRLETRCNVIRDQWEGELGRGRSAAQLTHRRGAAGDGAS